MASRIVLKVEKLATAFEVKDVIIPILDDVNFCVFEGESLGIVGESGSGKSVLAHTIMGLLPDNGRVLDGQIRFKDSDLLKLPPKEHRRLKGDRMAMIFQEPMTALNPVYTVGRQIAELIRNHRRVTKKQALNQAAEMLAKVGIPDPEACIHRYPHELSGGMRQRVVIALAITLAPALLLADEPTTALDVSIQAQILNIIKSLQASMQMSTLFITHDLGVVAGLCQRVVVMYAGQVVETGTTEALFETPRHPYTSALLKSIPKLETDAEFLPAIEGSVPHPQRMPPGCRFAPRCRHVMERCRRSAPVLHELSENASARCWLYHQERVGHEDVERTAA